MSVDQGDSSQPLLGSDRDDSSSELAAAKATSNRFRVLARLTGCGVAAFSLGWHDGCIGPLIPYLQAYYGGINDRTVSLIFIGSFIGYIAASLLNVTLSTRIGLGRLIVLGAATQGIASAIIASQPPFAIIIVCYIMAGFGLAFQDAQFNVYVARLPNASTKLGFVHAIYGFGAMASPIAVTLLMQAKIPPPLFYFTNFTWCVASVTVLLTGFGFSGSSSSELEAGSTVEGEERAAVLRTVVSSPVIWRALLFVCLYTGVESGEAGWVVSFLMRERNGGAISGYASSAFYGGLTSSRVILLPLTALLTEKRAISLYAIIALAMQVVVWTTPSFLVDFIAIAACGFVMGPVYPITVSLVTKATPRRYHPGAISLMACVSAAGSAVFPFVVGSLAESHGIIVLQPLLVTILAVMLLVWQLVASPKAQSQRS
ncbi:hypothetical protein BP5796_02071 [Coleophoma crateriformis]|uniref:Major facilitator superfamily (MFS) profile domain-containing protein n=1 Tax=Coleophoma crateriformis TaxID=565419 RepID=A0A3D8T272_9HELO|nr:hypothetical protein BP5796_02071 [Coleophoma crateriformis]